MMSQAEFPRLRRPSLRIRQGAALALALAAALALPAAARAQSVIATINSDPVTTVDLAERAKLLRAMGLPSSNEETLESLIKSRLEAGEINKFGIKVKTSELGPVMTYYAEKAHTTPEALAQRLAAAKVDKKHLENFLSIHEAFNIYARARNRAVDASAADVQAEIARDPKLAHAVSYSMRQVMVTVASNAPPAEVEAAAKEMQALHTRFTDCETGKKLVTEFPNLVVREPISRTSAQLGEQLVALLDKTPVGHLTPPSRDSQGVVSLAVCSRTAANQDTLKDAARDKVLARKINADAEQLYLEMRKTAVIVKTKS
jgi:peptidyl-prolyl cis-trans isomerase SurA